MPRPQFTLRSLLVAMLVVGAFFGGAEWAKRRWTEDRATFERYIEFHKRLCVEAEEDNIRLRYELEQLQEWQRKSSPP